jgi:hypothetical protein
MPTYTSYAYAPSPGIRLTTYLPYRRVKALIPLRVKVVYSHPSPSVLQKQQSAPE